MNLKIPITKNKLDIGLQTQNNTVLTEVLQQLQQIVASNSDIRGRVEVLQDSLSQIKRDAQPPPPENVGGPPPRLRGQPPNLSGKEDVSQLKPVNPIETRSPNFYNDIQTLFGRSNDKDNMDNNEIKSLVSDILVALKPVLETSYPQDNNGESYSTVNISKKYSNSKATSINKLNRMQLDNLLDYLIPLMQANMFPSSSGSGMKGRGIKPRKYTSQVLPTDVDYNKGIKATAKFVPMGRHLININQLDKDIIAIKRKKGSVINTLPSQRVTRKLGGVIRKIIGGSLPTFDELNDLDDEEKLYLSKVASETQIGGKLSIPTPKKTSEEQDINQFEILRGQILAGQDNPDVVRQFKSIILKLSNKNLIPKAQVRDLLLDLTTLGH